MALDGFITIDNSNPSTSGLYVVGLPGVTIAQLDGVTKDEQADYQATFEYIYALAQTNLKIDVQRALAQRFHIDKKLVSRETSKFLTTAGTTVLAGVKISFSLSKYSRIHITTAEVYSDPQIADITIDWEDATTLPYSPRSSAYGLGMFVVVGPAGISTSTDCILWINRVSPNSNSWESVTFGRGRFVAVAQSGASPRVMYSLNGIDWTEASAAANYSWQVVKWIEELGMFVAGASATGAGLNGIMTSSNGINWTLRTTAGNFDWEGLAYGNGVLVATNSSNKAMYSADAITWTLVATPGIGVEDVTFGNGVFVSGSSNGFVYSTDGILWTAGTFVGDQSHVLTPAFNSLVFTGTYFIVTSGSTFAAISENGINWYETDAPPSDGFGLVSDGSNMLVFISDDEIKYGAISGVNLDVFVYDTDEDGDLLGTFTKEGIVAGKNVIQINADFDAQDIFVAFNSSSGFRSSENRYYSNREMSYDKLSCTFPCTFGEGSVTQVNGGGLNVKFNVFCSMMKVIEDNINLFQYALWYRIGVDIMKERVVSDRVDRFTVLTPERAVEMTAIVEKDYQNALEAATMNLKFNEDPICFVCKKPIQAYTSLP